MLRFSQSNSDFTANSDVWSRIPGHILMPLLCGMALLVFSFSPSHAAEQANDTLPLGPHEFVIQASDGYGTSECLSQQSNCGKVIADAWCESHGHVHALGYSKAEDVTGVIKLNAPSLKIPRDAIIVSCGN